MQGGTPSHIFIYTQHPPGHFRTPHGTRLCIYTCGGPGLNPAYIYIYICRHVSGHVSTPGCVSRLGPKRFVTGLEVTSLCRGGAVVVFFRIVCVVKLRCRLRCCFVVLVGVALSSLLLLWFVSLLVVWLCSSVVRW